MASDIRAAIKILLIVFGIALVIAGCAEFQTYGQAVAEQRRAMNDLQARATLAGLCDLSAGSVSRLQQDQRDLVMRNCGLSTGTQLIMLQTPPVRVRR